MNKVELNKLLRVGPEFIPDFTPRSYTVTIELESMSCNTNPYTTIKINTQVYFEGFLTDGINNISFTVSNKEKRQMLKIIFNNKQENDTQVDNNGNIVADKRIKINQIKFDNISIRNYIYKSKFKRIDINESTFTNILAFNGVWRLSYSNPPLYHLARYNSSLFDNAEKQALHDHYFKELVKLYKEKTNLK
jgi:hypothetical protein